MCCNLLILWTRQWRNPSESLNWNTIVLWNTACIRGSSSAHPYQQDPMMGGEVYICVWGETSTCNNFHLAISSLTNKRKESGVRCWEQGAPWGKEQQEIIRLEGTASPPLLTPCYGALFPSPRPTFTSGQPYLMLLDLSWHRVTEQRCIPHSHPLCPRSLPRSANEHYRLVHWEAKDAQRWHSLPPSGFLRRTTTLKESVFFYRPFTFWSVHPLIVHVAGNGMSRLDCIALW